MFEQNPQPSSAAEDFQIGLDAPAAGQNVYDRAIFLTGWVRAPRHVIGPCHVCAYLGDDCIAETRALYQRAEDSGKIGLSREGLSEFRMLGKTCVAETETRAAAIRLTASWNSKVPQAAVEQPVVIVATRLNERHHGETVFPENDTLLHRENIYGSGPPLSEPGIEAANLILGYLPEAASVVDIGCGAGAYGPALIAAGHDWLGVETDSRCCEILRHRQLPFRRAGHASSLPGCAGEWDCGICIEVLEHVQDPETFVREIARVIRGRALFSVPNMEVLPYTYGWGVVPWHLLEADHKTFFTRSSLRALLERHFRRVEISCFGEHPLRMREGIPIYVHLFAVADK